MQEEQSVSRSRRDVALNLPMQQQGRDGTFQHYFEGRKHEPLLLLYIPYRLPVVLPRDHYRHVALTDTGERLLPDDERQCTRYRPEDGAASLPLTHEYSSAATLCQFPPWRARSSSRQPIASIASTRAVYVKLSLLSGFHPA